MSKSTKKQEREDPTELTVQSIIDYTVCGLFYDCRYNRNLPEKYNYHDLRNERFEAALKEIVQYYFFKRQADQTVSLKVLINKFEKKWFPKDMTAYDIAIDQHAITYETLTSYATNAVSILQHFTENFGAEGIEPMVIAEPYLIPIHDDLRLSGSIDLIVRVGREYRVIKFGLKRTRPKPHFFEFAALKMAFDHRNNHKRQATYHFYDIGASKNAFVPISQPTEEDVNALMYWALEIRDSPNIVPRRGFTSYCRGCEFDETCKNFVFPKAEEVLQ